MQTIPETKIIQANPQNKQMVQLSKTSPVRFKNVQLSVFIVLRMRTRVQDYVYVRLH